MITSKGGLTYSELRNMPLPELACLHEIKDQLIKEMNRKTNA